MMRCIFSKPHAIIACFASALLLAGCTSNKTSYMGVNFNDASVPPQKQLSETEIRSKRLRELLNPRPDVLVKLVALDEMELGRLAQRANTGDKHAQLELGIRFEEGRGVERDLKKARKLYGKAASDSGGTIWVYSPPVGNSPGRVIPLNTGPKFNGLTEAKKRLIALEGE